MGYGYGAPSEDVFNTWINSFASVVYANDRPTHDTGQICWDPRLPLYALLGLNYGAPANSPRLSWNTVGDNGDARRYHQKHVEPGILGKDPCTTTSTTSVHHEGIRRVRYAMGSG